MKTSNPLLSMLCAVFASGVSPSDRAAAQTAFAYQGKLSEGTNAANGLYDFRFSVFESASNGVAIGGPLELPGVPVTNGLFTILLDFGASVFNGQSRWLEIAVQNSFTDSLPTVLTPRQPITSTPYAITAANLMSISNAPLDIKINGERVLRLEPTVSPAYGDARGAPNVIGGSADNYVVAGVVGATIAGGGATEWFDGGYHNTVIEHFGTVSGGLGNTSSGIAATVGGGFLNFSTAYGANVDGGQNNVSAGPYSTIGGGIYNTSGGDCATIGGGSGNHAIAPYTTIGGGFQNFIETNSFRSTIGGGGQNVIERDVTRSTIAGGEGNRLGAFANSVTIGGGRNNTVLGPTGGTTIAGGVENSIQDEASGATISGGWYNAIANNAGNSTIAGGWRNYAAGSSSSIGGGENNLVGNLDSHHSTIAGGRFNSVVGDAGTVGGGAMNTARGDYATVAGGFFNRIQPGGPNVPGATVGGGVSNSVLESSYCTIGGGFGNSMISAADGSTISGGQRNLIDVNTSGSSIGGGMINIIGRESVRSTIAGGERNSSAAPYASIGGGSANHVASYASTIAGGSANTIAIRAESATIAGGNGNEIGEQSAYAAVGGGHFNIVRSNAQYSVIPGGFDNLAAAPHSFAAGSRAQALHTGAFVWSDSSRSEPSSPFETIPFASTAGNQFSVRATGGVRFLTGTNGTAGAELLPGSGSWSALSDRNAKENFVAADPHSILDKVVSLPLATWNYKSQDKSIRHIGPTAQDFRAAFGVGESDRSITTVDADGVALAAIQGLNRKLEDTIAEKEDRIRNLEKTVAELRQLVSRLSTTQH